MAANCSLVSCSCCLGWRWSSRPGCCSLRRDEWTSRGLVVAAVEEDWTLPVRGEQERRQCQHRHEEIPPGWLNLWPANGLLQLRPRAALDTITETAAALLTLAADAVTISVKAVGVRSSNREVPPPHVGTVEVGRRWRYTEVGVGG